MEENAGGPARFEETLRDFWATRPVRPSSGGKLAGVSAGIGARYGIDPVLIRIGFALLAFYGGSGVVLYLLGWLLLPKENRSTSSPESPPETAPAPVAVVLVVFLLPLMLFWVNSFAGLVGLLAGFAAIYLLHHYYADRGNAAVRRDSPPPTAGSGASAETAGESGTTTSEFASGPPEPPPREPQPPAQRSQTWLSIATALLAVAAAVVVLLTGQDPVLAAACALGVLGTGMIVGSFLGAGRRLIGVAIPLGVVVLLLSAPGPGLLHRTAELVDHFRFDVLEGLALPHDAPAVGSATDLIAGARDAEVRRG